jgi:hypothetical protein
VYGWALDADGAPPYGLESFVVVGDRAKMGEVGGNRFPSCGGLADEVGYTPRCAVVVDDELMGPNRLYLSSCSPSCSLRPRGLFGREGLSVSSSDGRFCACWVAGEVEGLFLLRRW